MCTIAHAYIEPRPSVSHKRWVGHCCRTVHGWGTCCCKMQTSDSQAQLIGRQSTHKLLPTPVTVSGVSVISTLWLLVTFLCTAGLIIAAGFPNWAVVDSPRNSIGISDGKIGLFYFCYTPSSSDGSTSEECSPYLPPFAPSNATRLSGVELGDIAYLFASSVVYGAGTMLLALSLLFGGVAYCKPRIKGQSVFLVGFTVQLFACQ